MTPSPLKDDASPPEIAAYLREMHDCVDRHGKRNTMISIASFVGIATLLLAVLTVFFKASVWIGHIDGKLDNVEQALHAHDGEFGRIDAQMNVLENAIFGADRANSGKRP